MRTIKEDFIAKFGKDKFEELQCVKHSEELPPSDEVGKVIFRLLEMIDFNCFKYGDNQGMDENEVRCFLKTHSQEIFGMNIKPTSSIGLLSGVFNFMQGD